MPFRTPQHPHIKIDHRTTTLTCTHCGATSEGSPISGLEGIMDRLQPFAREHSKCTKKRGGL